MKEGCIYVCGFNYSRDGMYISANHNCSVEVESPVYTQLLGVCCHYCGVDIENPELLSKAETLRDKYHVVKPACITCPDFIKQRPISEKTSLKKRKEKRKKAKRAIERQVRKKMRTKPPLSQAQIPRLSTNDSTSAAFEEWLGACQCFKCFAKIKIIISKKSHSKIEVLFFKIKL